MTSESALPRVELVPPVVACYCATFLKPEMLHIYRQITALPTFRAVILTRKREQEGRFPFDEVRVVPSGRKRWLRRIWQKQFRRQPMTIGPGEVRTLARALTSIAPRVFHVYFGHVAVQLMPLLRCWRVAPVVVSFHGADVLVDMERPAHRQATLSMLDRADLVLARSRSLMEALVHLGCRPEKIRLHRTGIPLDEFPYRARAYPPPDGAWRLLQACRLIEKKGLFTTLQAFARFARAYPLARLTLAGDGPMLGALREMSRNLGIADRVTFAGFLSQADLRRELAASHFFLHPSELGGDGNQEGVPNSLLEAMSTGLPVLGSHHGGIPEAITHGQSGWLIHEGDSEELAAGLLFLARHPSQAETMGRAASQVVRDTYELTTQAACLEKFYYEAMNAWVP